MGNCANKPLTTEGEAPAEAPEQKTTVEEREIEVDQNKVPSLAQMLEDDGKKPEAEGVAKPAEEKTSEPPKIEEVAKEVVVETKKEEASKPASEPPKPEESKPVATAEKKPEGK